MYANYEQVMGMANAVALSCYKKPEVDPDVGTPWWHQLSGSATVYSSKEVWGLGSNRKGELLSLSARL